MDENGTLQVLCMQACGIRSGLDTREEKTDEYRVTGCETQREHDQGGIFLGQSEESQMQR